MRDYTMEQLLEWYAEAVSDLEIAESERLLDDEEHDKIAELESEVEELEVEIKRRKGEHG